MNNSPISYLTCQGDHGHLDSHYTINPSTTHVEIEWDNADHHADAEVFNCENCGRDHLKTARSDVRMMDGSTVCTSCECSLHTCHGCQMLIPGHEDHHYTIDADVLCETCIEDSSMRQCYDCEYFVDYDDGQYWENELFLCPSCHNGREYREDNTSDLIHYYTYTPEFEFYGTGKVYLGWELETEVHDNRSLNKAAQAVLEVTDAVYLKEDGSISRGFEMVSHPMTHAYARDEFPWKLLNTMVDHGCHTNPRNNGLHVHVNRAGFESPAHVYRWLKFMYRNAEQVRRVARRDSNEWAAWDIEDRDRAKEFAKGDQDADRYRAINVTNDHTFEVRVFAASLNPPDIMAALDLVAGSVEYTRHLNAHTVNRGGWEWAAFVTWLRAQDGTYAALTDLEDLKESA